MQINSKRDTSETRVVGSYVHESVAHVMVGLLKEHGIDCMIDGSTLINITLPAGALQIKIRVRAEDEPRALELIEQYEKDNLQNNED